MKHTSLRYPSTGSGQRYRSSPRLSYAYHYQAVDKALIFRYDNAASAYVMPLPLRSCRPPTKAVPA